MKKILFVHEAASQASILSNYLSMSHWKEYSVKHLLYFNHKYYKQWKKWIQINLWLNINDLNNKLNKILAWMKIIIFLVKNSKLIFDADIIHFFAWSTFLPQNLDLFFLKKIMRKKIIMEFNWSDVRKPNHSNQINKFFKFWTWWYYNNDFIVDKKIKKIDKYTDKIIVPYYELYYNVVWSISNQDKISVLYHIIDSSFIFSWKIIKNPNKIKIIHAPTNKWIKWSEYILKIVSELKNKFWNLEYEELTNIPRNTILEKINESDIVIDQLILWDFWVFSLESMYNNKITLCYLLDEVKNKYPSELPIINVNINNLEKKLEEIILNIATYREIWNKWNDYVIKNHSEEVIWRQYIDIIEKRL